MKHTLSELAEISGAALEGDGSLEVVGPAALRHAAADQISFYEGPRFRRDLERTRAGAVVVAREAELPRADFAVLRCDDAGRAFTRIVQVFADDRPRLEPGVHPSAVVDSSAELGEGVAVGPLAVVGPGCVVGADVQIHPHVVLGREVRVGADSVLHAGVVVYDGVALGRRCIVHSGTVLGSDGYGFEPTPDGWVKIPQLGTVEIGDDVEIGAGCTVDRGRFGPTRIGRGVKLDDQVHVAHNVELGEHVMCAAQVGISGSVRVGARAMFGGQSGVSGHCTVGEGARIGGGSGVIGDVPPGVEWWGTPSRAKGEVLRSTAGLRRLPALAARVKELEQRLSALEAREREEHRA